MRSFLGGLLLALLLPAACFAQVSGQVLSIGFDNLYRPDCWTPMRVQLKAEKEGEYEIQVHQEDLDKDTCIFKRAVTLTAGVVQPEWMYFVPQPTDGGLLDTTRGGTLAELRQQLHVYICTRNGEKQIAQLPITSTVTNLDAGSQGPGAVTRGRRLILAVVEGRNSPVWRDYENSVGIAEDVVFVNVQPGGLPDDPRAYEAVDAVLWSNAVPLDPLKPTDEARFRALQEYVREGGRLVICQPPQRDATIAFGDLLPVRVDAVVDAPDAGPLRDMSLPRASAIATGRYPRLFPDARARVWETARGPFRLARATPKPNAVVERWADDGTPGAATRPARERTPYLVRAGYGAGSVTWVAQDLADPAVTRVKSGWPYIWDRVFGWSNDTLVAPPTNTDAEKDEWVRASDPYKPGPWVDVGAAFNAGMELSGRSTALVGLAVVFFIVYWLVAGPGLFVVLLAKSRAHLSWFLFAAAALAATAVTVLVVKGVVRGAPEMRHVTLVRKGIGAPVVARTRFGLYVPSDGPQTLELKDTDPAAVSYITPFPSRPIAQDGSAGFTANFQYDVPLQAGGADQGPVAVRPYYRSTLKKLAAKWVGPANTAVGGQTTLVQENEGSTKLTGKLTNGAGQALRSVYLVYHDPGDPSGGGSGGGVSTDQLLYYPSWAAGAVLDVDVEFNGTTPETRVQVVGPAGIDYGDAFTGRIKVRGPISAARGQTGWAAAFWYPVLARGLAGFASGGDFDDAGRDMKVAFPVASLIDLIPPSQNARDDSTGKRMEVLRRGVRQWNVSQAVTAGNLVVLAEGAGPMPVPLDVEGDRVGGDGTIYYQFVVPLKHVVPPPPPPPPPPTLEPATSPASVNGGMPAQVGAPASAPTVPGQLPAWKGE